VLDRAQVPLDPVAMSNTEKPAAVMNGTRQASQGWTGLEVRNMLATATPNQIMRPLQV